MADTYLNENNIDSLFDRVCMIVGQRTNFDMNRPKYLRIFNKLCKSIHDNNEETELEPINNKTIDKTVGFFLDYIKKKELIQRPPRQIREGFANPPPQRQPPFTYERQTRDSSVLPQRQPSIYNDFSNGQIQNQGFYKPGSPDQRQGMVIQRDEINRHLVDGPSNSSSNKDEPFIPNLDSYNNQFNLFLNGSFELLATQVTQVEVSDEFAPQEVEIDIGEVIKLDSKSNWKATFEFIQIQKSPDPDASNQSKWWGAVFAFEISDITDYIVYHGNKILNLNGKLLIPNEAYSDSPNESEEINGFDGDPSGVALNTATADATSVPNTLVSVTTAISQNQQTVINELDKNLQKGLTRAGAKLLNYKLKSNKIAILPKGHQIGPKITVKYSALTLPHNPELESKIFRGTDQLHFAFSILIERA